MKISVYLKKCSATTSNICFRVREKNVDIKVVSPIAVHDKYWDTDTLCYSVVVEILDFGSREERFAARTDRRHHRESGKDLLGEG